MSLINDALKRARQQQEGTPAKSPAKMPAILPANAPAERGVESWLLPVIIIFLIVAACFLIGLAFAHRTVTQPVVEVPPASADVSPVTSPQPVAVAAAAPASPSPETNTVTADPPADLPKLQGVFYDPTYPAAIVGGKTVHVGDAVGSYRVKAISQFTLTFTDAKGKDVTVHMGE